MRYLASNMDVRPLATEKELEQYFQFRKEHDVNLMLSPGIMEVIGTPYGDIQLFYESIKAGRDIPQEAMDRAADLEHAGLILDIGYGNDRYYPIMHTANIGLCDACGGYGKTLFLRESNCYRDPLLPEDRGFIFTRLLHTNKKPIHILIRDEEAACIASCRYQVLDAEEGYQTVKNYLARHYQNVEFDSAQVSQEYLAVTFHCEEDTSQIEYLLSQHGFEDPVKLEFRFTTSDTKDSKMKVTPIFVVGDSLRIPMGSKAISEETAIDHKKPNLIADLGNRLDNHLAIILRENEDAIENLGNTPIKHVAGCLQAITRRFAGLSSKTVNDIAADLMKTGNGTDGYAIDVYFAILKAVEQQCSNEFSLSEYLTLSERAAEYVFRSYPSYDRPYEDPDKD